MLFTNYNVYLSIIGLSMTLQHTAMEGKANWAQMTRTLFGLRYAFLLLLSILFTNVYISIIVHLQRRSTLRWKALS